METVFLGDFARQAMMVVIISVCLIVIPGLIVGLFVSVFQAATQINEQSLSFVPKLLATFTALIVLGPFILTKLSNYTVSLYQEIPSFVF